MVRSLVRLPKSRHPDNAFPYLWRTLCTANANTGKRTLASRRTRGPFESTVQRNRKHAFLAQDTKPWTLREPAMAVWCSGPGVECCCRPGSIRENHQATALSSDGLFGPFLQGNGGAWNSVDIKVFELRRRHQRVFECVGQPGV